MKITSMSNRELLKTLTGLSFYGVSPELRQADALSNGSRTNVNKTGGDRFESSDSMTFEETQSEGGTKNADSFEYSDDDIDFNDTYVRMFINCRTWQKLTRGDEGAIPTKESIASYFGQMAKRLDEAYAAGKFTKEEYDYLNEGILEQMEHYTANAERNAAWKAIMCKRLNSIDYCKRANSMTGEEFRAEIKEEIDAYVEKYFKIDRKVLMQLFSNVRYGKQEKPTEKEKAFLL